jgi:pimeloyl-ACP methyl ester carboxylesterase
MTTYYHATVPGQKLFYREVGPRDAPTIVLLHGFPSSSHMFRKLIPQLADRFHVIAPDYVGFGYSDAPNANESSIRSTILQRTLRNCCSEFWA